MDMEIDDPCGGIEVKELGIGISFRSSWVIGVPCCQVGSRPPGQCALGAPVEGKSINNLG